MSPRRAYHIYCNQIEAARRKGVPVSLSFAEWVLLWGDDIERRGPRPGQLFLERIEKPKGYAIGNLRISVRPAKKREAE